MSEPLTIYALIRKTDGYIFYVGITKNMTQRLANHRAGWKKTNDNHRLHRYIRECNNEIEMIPLQVLENPNHTWNWVENWYITFVFSLGFNLANSRQSVPNTLKPRRINNLPVSYEGIRQVEILYFKNKFNYIW